MAASDVQTAPHHFPFLKLPAELRISIYCHAIGPEVYVEDYYSRVARRKDVAYALVFANRQIHEEVVAYLYAKPTFIFRCRQNLRDFLRMINAKNRSHLRHMRLEFKPWDFLNFKSEASVLRQMTLESLHLCLRRQSELDYYQYEPYHYSEDDAEEDYEDAMNAIPKRARFLADHIPTIEVSCR